MAYHFKLSIICFLAGLWMSGGGNTAAQPSARPRTVTVSQSQMSLRELFRTIERQSSYLFFFVDADIDGIMVEPPSDLPVADILDAVLAEHALTYTIDGSHITVSRKRDAGRNPQQVSGSRPLTGTVRDAEGYPLIGAYVAVKNTTVGTITDVDGRFSLFIPADAVLTVSYTGFETKEVRPGIRGNLQIVLDEAMNILDDVVVVGYGTQRKVDVTGAISSVNVNDLKLTVASNAGEALQGQVAGVNVRASGLPGSSSTLSVRGITSFGDVSPLIIVDGVESNLNNISAQDIESIQVLKDARVAAIYGVRGSNGVILVTTRKGKAGAVKVTYNGMAGITFPLQGNVFNMANSEEYMQILNIAQPNNELFVNGMPDYLYNSPYGSGIGFEGDPQVDPSRYYRTDPNKGDNYLIQAVNKTGTDWFHEAFKKARFQEHNLSVAGGNEMARYFFSLGFLDQHGTMVETFQKRYNMRINTEFNIGKFLKVGENLNFFYRSYLPMTTGSQYGRIPDLYTLLPIIPVNDIMGNWGGTWIGPQLGSVGNPVAIQERTAANSDYDSYNVIGNVFAEATLFSCLNLRTSLGVNNYNTFYQTFTGAQAENAELNTRVNSLVSNASQGSTLTFNNTLNFKKDFGRHKLDALAGMEVITTYSKGLNGQSDDFFSTNKHYLLLQNGAERYPASSSAGHTALLSYFGRLDYNYDDKYLVGITVRRDGSSYFGPENRFGTFPSFSLGWRISQEKFMRELTWIDDLKIRASYGVLGSQNNVAALNQFSTFASSLYVSSYDMAGTSNSVVAGMYRQRIGNSATGWEEDVVQNAGVDIVAFNSALEFQLDVYKKKINGLLLTEPLPSVIGALVTAPTVNIGDIQNTGIDISAKYRFRIGRVFPSIAANFTRYKNKIVDLPDPGYFTSGSARNEEGHPTGMFYGYKIMGIFNSQEEVDSAPTQDGAAPGRFRFVDTDEDGKITADDRQYLGSPHPDFTYGFILGLRYMGFDFAAQFYGVQGNTIYNAVRMSTEFFQSNVTGNKSRRLLDAWTPEHTDTTVPKIENVQSFSTTNVFSSYALESGSYLRLKTLTLGYTFDPNFVLMRKLRLSNWRVYMQASNLFTCTRYSGADPDISGGSPANFGVDVATYPTNEPKLSFGITITY